MAGTKIYYQSQTSDIDEKSIIPVRFVPMVHPRKPYCRRRSKLNDSKLFHKLVPFKISIKGGIV
ncbi:MAG: hypothetical protein CM1200mP10_02290 [Candidatus Neomarinimicrobiota bacterium]|nr:MAG: hypothetical protein CM1200mP10_02290 [Candidatus Neomarinimicrobiota bacterium]